MLTNRIEKTLVVLIGSARGGEETWNTMYKYLLKQYDADLALCFGETTNQSSSLYKNAKYIWELKEYENWRNYYEIQFDENWDYIFELHKNTGLMGGIDDHIGSGAIIFAFRDFILKNKITILDQYDRIILTRSDFYYIDKHPILPLVKIYAVEGEEYGGVSDRHFVFDSDMAENVLGICDFICNQHNFNLLSKFPPNTINCESALLIYFKHTKIYEQMEYCSRVQFTVATNGDTTKWCVPGDLIPGSKEIRFKYFSEFEQAVRNLQSRQSFVKNLKNKFCLYLMHKYFKLKFFSFFHSKENTKNIFLFLFKKYFKIDLQSPSHVS
jgi:hypothetical protein